VAGQRRRVVDALVAELRAERLVAIGVFDQAGPVVVARLVAHVPQERPIRFPERTPPPLALGVVRLGQGNRDHAAVVTGEDRRLPVSRIRQELEGQAARISRARLGRQAQVEERVDQPALGRLQLAPGRPMPLHGRVGEWWS
jgi:hypothetical protein